jgi:predicted nucleic acid-binding Zn ribbon protein
MSRRPRPLAEAVAGLRAGLAPATLLADVQGAWEAVAGADVARHSKPVSERGGVVTIRCDSAVWASELTMMAPRLIDALGHLLDPPRGLRELRFVVGP